MDEGAEYAAVLAEAQARGYAEADPTEDVGGFDARAKLAILMRLALRAAVDPEEIVPRPIAPVSAVDFSYARDLGCTIRQIARKETALARCGHSGAHAGGAAFSAGLVARHREHGDPHRPLRRRCGLLRPRRRRPSHGSRRGQRSAGAGARIAKSEIPRRRRAWARSSKFRITFASWSRTARASWQRLPAALARADQHSRHRAEAGLSPGCTAVCGYRGAVQVFGAAAGAGRHSSMDCPGRAAGFADAGVAGTGA